MEWWHWIIAGFCLIGLELVIPSFTIIWFGTGALLVGLLTAAWPDISLSLQFLSWSVASIFFTFCWFRFFKNPSVVNYGSSKDLIIGETGIIIRGTDDSYGRGIVRFRIPILGADEWSCYSDETLKVGESVKVLDIEGQILKVTRI